MSRLFDEFAAALQFPWYFGENPDASDECLQDMDWLAPGAGYVIVVRDPELVLPGAPEDLAWLVHSLQRASAAYSEAVTDGQEWDRPPVPFQVVLQTDPAEATSTETRWAGAGARLTTPPEWGSGSPTDHHSDPRAPRRPGP